MAVVVKRQAVVPMAVESQTFADSEVTIRVPKVLSWVQPVDLPAQLMGFGEANIMTRRSFSSSEEAEDEHEDAHWLESDSNCNSDEETEVADHEFEEKLEEKICCDCIKHAQREDTESGQSTGDDSDDDEYCPKQDQHHMHRLIIPEISFDDVPWETCSIGHLSDRSSEEAAVMHSSYVYEPLSMHEDDEESDCSEHCRSPEVETSGEVDQVEEAEAVTYEDCDDVEEMPLWLTAELVKMHEAVSTVQCSSQQESEGRDAHGKVVLPADKCSSQQETTLELAVEGETHLMDDVTQADTGIYKENGGQAIETEENLETVVSGVPEVNRTAEDDAAKLEEPQTFTLEELTNPAIWRHLDVKPTERETLLTAQTFVLVFGMDKEAFQKLPRWRRDALKKQNQLF